jgi:hypothetical protein
LDGEKQSSDNMQQQNVEKSEERRVIGKEAVDERDGRKAGAGSSSSA